MRFSHLLRLVALLAILRCCATASLHAQVTYQGLLEGIYPTRLVIEEANPTASLSISTLGNRIAFIGGCDAGECKYRGVDTSLALVFKRTATGLNGRVQYGDGTSKELIVEQVDAGVLFPNTCAEAFWLRSWETSSKKHQLSLATLPGKQVKGTFYIAELGTSFSVSGTATSTQLNLVLEGTHNKKIGTLTALVDEQESSRGLRATLDLDGSETSLKLALADEMSLNCLQAAGRYDIVHPVVEGSDYATLPTELWKELVAQRSDYGHAWFEPTLFNAHVISGWMHREGPDGHTSAPINLLRDQKSKLKQNGLLGGKRTRTQLVTVHKARAMAQHPLRTNEAFQAWAKTLDFSNFTMTTEGLALASERHPVYGQLESIVAWRELPKAESLPNWLTQSN